MERKYFKPKSLAWWSGFVPLCTGLFIASEPAHQLVIWTDIARDMTGNLPPSMLINGGLLAIGLRGKDG